MQSEVLKGIIGSLQELSVWIADLESQPRCSFIECTSAVVAKDLCARHYGQFRRSQLKAHGVTGLKQISKPAEVDPRQTELFKQEEANG